MPDMSVDAVEVVEVVKVVGWLGASPESAGFHAELFFARDGRLLAGVCPGLLHRDIRLLVDVAGPNGELKMRCNPLPPERRSTMARDAWERSPLHGDDVETSAS